jgi:hypothetical protein
MMRLAWLGPILSCSLLFGLLCSCNTGAVLADSRVSLEHVDHRTSARTGKANEAAQEDLKGDRGSKGQLASEAVAWRLPDLQAALRKLSGGNAPSKRRQQTTVIPESLLCFIFPLETR